ncbi:ABC transporter ATP-binding protein [Nocardia acidivorans]|uniref:ABC transporter ATP-binding protein n=1 Tax=Nocardia acidivorans TaxID=404580 RepID=UPI000830C065|nr:ABC transporter ATP-binding protein [Nocardia acidivorans]
MTAQVVPEISSTAVGFVDVHRHYGNVKALDGLTLDIDPGEFIALLGPSGCGKTTALRILAGFDHPTSGEVLVGGRDASSIPANKRDMGMVFQSYSLFPTMSAQDNVAFGLGLRGRPAKRRRERARELLDMVGLAEHVAKYPHQLSGGQQQRVALARALAIAPRVLLLDEPLSALDAKVRQQLREEIRRIQRELGVTTVFVTHDQEEALAIADRVAVMRNGRMEQCASPDQVYQRPATPFVAEFVGTMNRIPATAVDATHVRVGEQILPCDGEATAEGEVTVLARPEAVLVHESPDGTATVVAVTFFGATTRLRLTRPEGLELLADVASHRAADLTPGTRVEVSLLDRPVLLAADPR